MAENNSIRSVMIAVEEDICVDDSLSWEVIDPSDDDSDNFSYDSSLESDVVEDADVEIESKDASLVGSPDSDVSMQSLVEQIDLHRLFVKPTDAVAEDDEMDGGDYGYDDVDDEEDDVEYGLDDELVPKWVNDRFERQRMRKLGKRAYPKMNKSKRLPYLYNRPGCVHGKHGLGLKHSLM